MTARPVATAYLTDDGKTCGGCLTVDEQAAHGLAPDGTPLRAVDDATLGGLDSEPRDQGS
jgi:hypothetical protein